MAGQGGDDLEDDYVPDEFIASSGDEEDSRHGSSHGDLSLDDEALKPSGSAAPTESEKSNKRKRSGKDRQRKLKVGISIKPLDYPKLNAREQKPKLKEKQDEQSSLIALQSPHEFAEYLAGSQAKSFSRLSRIELEDIRIPGGCGSQRVFRKSQRINIQTESAIVDTSPWVAERTLDSLPDFIAKGGPSQKKTETWD
jgi:protein CMS1